MMTTMSFTKRVFSMVRIVLATLLAALVPAAAAAGTIVYYHNDLAGSPIAATNESGQVIWRESYRPYGERLTNDPASAANKVWFTSRSQDAATGLVYMGARWYDPVVGRFVSTDPKTFDEQNLHSFNRYAYANNNPLKYVDPDGKVPVPLIIWAAVKGAIAWGGAGFLASSSADAVSQAAAFGNVDWKGAGQEGLAAAPGWALAGAANEALSIGLAARAAESAAKGAAGFASETKLAEHVAKHGGEWTGGMSQGQYLSRAQQLLRATPGGDILGHVRASGDILRYNVATNEFAVQSAEGTIRTFFRPTEGMAYWIKQVGP